MDIAEYTKELGLEKVFLDLISGLPQTPKWASEGVIRIPGGYGVEVECVYGADQPYGEIQFLLRSELVEAYVDSEYVSFGPVSREAYIRCVQLLQGRTEDSPKDNASTLFFDYMVRQWMNGGTPHFVGNGEGRVGGLMYPLEDGTNERTLSSFTKAAFQTSSPYRIIEHLACLGVALRRLIWKNDLENEPEKEDIVAFLKRRGVPARVVEGRAPSSTIPSELRELYNTLKDGYTRIPYLTDDYHKSVSLTDETGYRIRIVAGQTGNPESEVSFVNIGAADFLKIRGKSSNRGLKAQDVWPNGEDNSVIKFAKYSSDGVSIGRSKSAEDLVKRIVAKDPETWGLRESMSVLAYIDYHARKDVGVLNTPASK